LRTTSTLTVLHMGYKFI